MVDKAMRYAYEVYKEKSFSQAAKNLYVSQPALSLAIRKLEDRLGLQIFDRSTTPISLTAEGQMYIDTAQRILRLSEQLESYMDDRRRLHTGRITVGATPSVHCTPAAGHHRSVHRKLQPGGFFPVGGRYGAAAGDAAEG